MASFSDMLVYLRKRSEMSQKELAEKIGVSRSTIGMYETGAREPDFETAEALADIFNVNMDTLLGSSKIDNKIKNLLSVTSVVRIHPPPPSPEYLDFSRGSGIFYFILPHQIPSIKINKNQENDVRNDVKKSAPRYGGGLTL